MAYNRELFDCSICLQLLEDPVTTACGHSYCMKCIDVFWDTNQDEKVASTLKYSCPQCRQLFYPRPVLKRNIVLADLLEQQRRKPIQDAAAADDDDDGDGDDYATPGDLQCDVCRGRKRKACKFCCVCLASYCETHLQTHVEDPLLQKHSLIPATVRFRGHICGCHDKLLEIYCRSDQEYLCFLCMAEHKDHDVVSVTALKYEKQIQLKRTQQEVTDRMLTLEWKRAKLNDAADSIRDAAWVACDDFERLSAEHVRAYVRSMERKCTDMREKVGEIEKAGLDWTINHLRQVQCDMLELRRREDKINQLLLTEDPIQFLKGFQAMGDLPVLTDSHERLDTLTAFVTAQQDKLKNICKQKKNELFICSEKHVLLKMPMLQEEITSRTKLLTMHGNSRLEVDPNTIAAHLCLSNSNTEISWSDKDQGHPDHAKRFTYYHQALCKQGLKGKHYWEVAWDGGIVELAVSYKSIERKGSGKNCCFGHNNLSWKIICSPTSCTFWHNNLHKGQIPPAHSRRIGVCLDYEAGLLGFYSISDSDRLTLLQQIQTTFSEPLYPGFSVDLGASLAIYAASKPVHINNH